MNNLGTLYRFELRKILRRRITSITLIAVALLMIAMNIGEYAAGMKIVNREEQALSGRSVDEQMLCEMREAISPNTVTAEDGTEMIIGLTYLDTTYKPLADYLNTIAGNSEKAYNMTEEGLETRFEGMVEENLRQQHLSDAELSYWQARRAESPMPLTYGQLQNGWGDSVCIVYAAAILIMITIAATLSGVFSDEMQLRTDALVFSSRNGKKKLAAAKLLAGITAGLLETIIILLVCVGTEFAVSGFGGGETSVQFFFGPTAMDMSIRRVFWIYIGIMMLIGILMSVFAMCLSQVFRNSIAVIASMMVLWLLSMITLPYSMRLLSQISSYMPVTFLGSWTFSDYRTVRVFGQMLTILEMAPIVYFLLSVLFGGITRFSYSRYQVTR